MHHYHQPHHEVANIEFQGEAILHSLKQLEIETGVFISPYAVAAAAGHLAGERVEDGAKLINQVFQDSIANARDMIPTVDENLAKALNTPVAKYATEVLGESLILEEMFRLGAESRDKATPN